MKVLIIEDETSFRKVIEEQLIKDGDEACGVGTGKEGLALIASQEFDVIITDLRLPDIDGVEIIEQARQSGTEAPFLLMTAFASVKTAISALKAGAADYLIKPIRVADLVRRARQIYDLEFLKQENVVLRKMIKQDSSVWFPETPESKRTQQMVAKVSKTNMTVLINGESGTGKGVTARVIHAASDRAKKPFISVNCGAIPETLMESELFGHVKGAFTGANTKNDGLFVTANGGTLFLDEIGELPLPMQVKLLTVLEEKKIRPVGGTSTKTIDVRIIAATNRDLAAMVDAGTFRQDLLYRLNIFQVSLAPLRQQINALRQAVEFFISKHAQTYDVGEVEIEPEVWDCFESYSWPGNLRELDNVIERALLMRNSKLVTINELPPNMIASESQMPMPNFVEGGDASRRGFKERVQDFEKQIINQAIFTNGGDRRLAAEELGIGLSTLYRKLEE